MDGWMDETCTTDYFITEFSKIFVARILGAYYNFFEMYFD